MARWPVHLFWKGDCDADFRGLSGAFCCGQMVRWFWVPSSQLVLWGEKKKKQTQSAQVGLRSWMEQLKMGQSLWLILQGVEQMWRRAPRSKRVDQSSLKGSPNAEVSRLPSYTEEARRLRCSLWGRETTGIPPLPIFMNPQMEATQTGYYALYRLWGERHYAHFCQISLEACWPCGAPPFPLPALV